MSAHTHSSRAASDQGADLADELRSRGLRMTAQREQVLAAVRKLGHATPEQISEVVPDVDVATVYRTLELLEELQLVKHTHLGHGPASYRPVEDDHVHVVCHECGRVIEVARDVEAAVRELERRLWDGSGFEVDRSHLTIFGTCDECGQHRHDDADREHAAPDGR
jgi:Fur family ferric uptake transcriptional regulator